MNCVICGREFQSPYKTHVTCGAAACVKEQSRRKDARHWEQRREAYNANRREERRTNRPAAPGTLFGPFYRCISSDVECCEIYTPGHEYAATLIRQDIEAGTARPEWFRRSA